MTEMNKKILFFEIGICIFLIVLGILLIYHGQNINEEQILKMMVG